jgi:hypothetical protein
MATKRTSEEKDYQDLLKVTQSMLGDMGKAMSDLGDSSDGRNRKLKQEADITKQILGSVTDVADTNKLINAISRQQTNINKQNYGVNEQLKNSQLAQLDAVKAILQTGQQTAKVFKGVDDILSETASSFTSGIDGIMSKLQGIPIIGKALGNLFQPLADNAKKVINKTVSKFGTGFKKSFLESRVAGTSFTGSLTNGLKGGIEGMSGMLRVAGRFLAVLGPIGIAIAVIAAGFALGFARFKELDSAAKAFREETGLLNSQTTTLRDNIKSVSTEFAGLGVSAADVSKSASAFTTEFSGLEQPSKEVLGSMVMLNKNFGIGVEQGAQLNKVFQNIGGLTAEQSQALIGQTVSMAKMAGVAPSQVIKDMAESSEYAYRYFNGSPKALAAAAVEAAKLGTSIRQAGEVADGLLDFESSITSELEASAILGTNLNLSQARYLAANGDILGAQQAVLDQVASLGDITKLNKFEQDALTKATGMQMGDLINQQRIREQFGKLDKEQLEAAMSLMNSGRDITKLNASDLRAQTAKLATQKEMQTVMDDLSNSGSAISTAFQDMFEPFAATIMPVIADLASMVSSVLVPAFRLVGSVIKLALAPFGFILGVLGAVGKAVTNFLVTPLNFVVNSFNRIVDALTQAKGVLTAFSLIFAVLLGYQQRSLIIETSKMLMTRAGTFWEFAKTTALSAQNGIRAIGEAIQKKGILKSIADLAINAGKAVAGIPVVGPLLMAAAAAGAFALGMSFFGKAGDINSPADGTTRISTKEGGLFELSKNDDIMAAPGLSDAMSNKSSGGLTNIQSSPMIDISALVSKMNEIVLAVQSNRDVYMDKEKVSSAVVKTNEKSGENRFGLMGA